MIDRLGTAAPGLFSSIILVLLIFYIVRFVAEQRPPELTPQPVRQTIDVE
jgi:hypothetical protein